MNKKRTFLFLIFGLLALTLQAQNFFETSNGDKHLLGEIQISNLEEEPYDQWFNIPYQNKLKGEVAQNLQDYKMTIYLGTWCGDSKKWVPKVLKLWQNSGLSAKKIKIIALHNKGEQYKRSPQEFEKGLNIHRVPTFVFYKSGTEVARIVESPINSLERDFEQISLGIPSQPRYRAVNILHSAFQNENTDSLFITKKFNSILSKTYKQVSKPAELNTYGYVLKARGELKKAEFVFYLNTHLFSYDPNTWDSLGEIYLEQNKLNKAKENYEKVLELKPENGNAKKKLAEIKSKIGLGIKSEE